MGCDIHLVLERKQGDKWVGVNAFDCGHDSQGNFRIPSARNRNYKRFAALAGVRGDGPEAKGLPKDVSELSELLAHDWGNDGHSHSWMGLSEASRVFLETDWPCKDEDNESFKQSYPAYHFFGVESDEANRHEYRIVFWFDN